MCVYVCIYIYIYMQFAHHCYTSFMHQDWHHCYTLRLNADAPGRRPGDPAANLRILRFWISEGLTRAKS